MALLVLAYRPAPRTFQLALRGYSVASLPRALRFALESRLLCSRAFRASRSRKFSKKKYVSIDSKCSETRKNAKKFYPFDPLCAKFTKIFEQKSVSQLTRNALKRTEMQKKITPLRVAQNPSSVAQ